MGTNNVGQQAVSGDLLPRPPASSSAIDPNLVARPTWRGRLRALRNALVGGIGLVMGIVPHVLHHVTLLAGTALVAGSGARHSSGRWDS